MISKKGFLLIDVSISIFILISAVVMLLSTAFQYNKLVLENKKMIDTLILSSEKVEKVYDSNWDTLGYGEIKVTDYSTTQMKVNINGYDFIIEKSIK